VPVRKVLSAKSEKCFVLKEAKFRVEKFAENSKEFENLLSKNHKRGPKLFLRKIKYNKTSSGKFSEETTQILNNKQSKKRIKKNISQFNNNEYNRSKSKKRRSRSFYRMIPQLKWPTIEQDGSLKKLSIDVMQQLWTSGSTEDTFCNTSHPTTKNFDSA
jgi:hypothetical protein